MQLFDAHCHLQDARLLADWPAVLRRAAAAGVAGVQCCGCTEQDWPLVAELARGQEADAAQRPALRIFPSFGLHPCHIAGHSQDWLRVLEDQLSRQPAGIGEIGLDRLVAGRDDLEQGKIFVGQLELARRMRRPVTIHCRRAWGRLLEILRRDGLPPAGLMVHAWSGSLEVLEELLELGAYVSFAGNITFPHHQRARRALLAMPADRLLLETDSPDLLPAGAAGEWNEPANLGIVFHAAAELRGVPDGTLAEALRGNIRRFLGGLITD